MMTIAMLTYWAGALADWYTTKRGLSRGGKELNPVAKWLMRVLGRDWAVTVLKLGIFLLLLWQKSPAWVFFWLGFTQLVVAYGNHRNWWGKLLHKWKTRKSRLPK